MANMSEGFAPLAFAAFGGSTGFRGDARFAPLAEADEPPLPRPTEPEAEPEDPLAREWAEGFIAGAAQARAEAEALAQETAAAREALGLSFARLDRELEEELRLRLRDTVAALCEEALAPLALDEAALVRRIERAVSMLARADDERVIRLHPQDMALVRQNLPAEWTVQGDPALERGALRIETANGGVEDGPAQWRRAIAEALHQC